jgi:murein DD-endopeptidase MepM/ murein hydrolase activator NlpD
MIPPWSPPLPHRSRDPRRTAWRSSRPARLSTAALLLAMLVTPSATATPPDHAGQRPGASTVAATPPDHAGLPDRWLGRVSPCVSTRSAACPSAVSTAGPTHPTTVQPAHGWRWPLAGRPAVVRRFDPPASPYGPGHRGVDLAAVPGARVLAAGRGVVVWAGVLAGRGVVSVRHQAGLRTTYEPLTPTVRAGQVVPAGDSLGLLAAGHLGCLRAACLHWGLLRGTTYLDPLALFGRRQVRLLPRASSAPAAAAGGPLLGSEPTGSPQADPPLEQHRLISPSTTAAVLGLAVALALINSRRRPP